jgi:hypothetical protein
MSAFRTGPGALLEARGPTGKGVPMDGKRVAVVVSHPAHVLAVAGMLQRWQPDVLVLYRAGAGPGAGQGEAVRAALRAFGLADRLTNLEIGETESFDRALAGDFAFHAAISDHLFDWLRATRPGVVLGGAYEAHNYHHDVARLLLDDAVQRWRVFGQRVENYEFPLACRIERPDAPVQYGKFPFGPFRALRLDEREVAVKRELVALVGRTDPFVADIATRFADPEVEQYREVPADRDYTVPPPGLARCYDERGVVAAGLYPHAITFSGQFVPLVRALGLAPMMRTAA